MGETQESLLTHERGKNHHLKYHPWLNTSEDVRARGLGLQKKGRQFTGS